MTERTDLRVPALPGLLRPGCVVVEVGLDGHESRRTAVVTEATSERPVVLAHGMGPVYYAHGRHSRLLLDLDHPESVDAALRFLAGRHLGGTDFGRPYYDMRLPPAWFWTTGHDAAHKMVGRGWVLEDPAGGISWTFKTDEADSIKALAEALRAEPEVPPAAPS